MTTAGIVVGSGVTTAKTMMTEQTFQMSRAHFRKAIRSNAHLTST